MTSCISFSVNVTSIILLMTLQCVMICSASIQTNNNRVNNINCINSYRKLFTTSLAHVVWHNMNDDIFNCISTECSRDMKAAINGLQNNLASSYAFIDASGKSPSGILDGTISSYGDYDQCLQQSGTFCMVRLQVDHQQASVDSSRHHSSDISSTDSRDEKTVNSVPSMPEIHAKVDEILPIFAYFYLNMGLCMPSSCSAQDVATIVNKTLSSSPSNPLIHHSLPVSTYRNITCDTAQSITLASRVQFSQLLSASFVALMTSLVVLGTVCSLLLDLREGDTKTTERSSAVMKIAQFMAQNFCMIKNSRSMMAERSGPGGVKRISALDYLRLTVIFAGIAGHCLACLETVPSWTTIARLLEVKSRFKLLLVQPLINEAGLGLVTFLGGLATFLATVDPISRGTFSFKYAIFDRWIRYMPSLMSMVAIDILWPLSGSGPLFTQIANHLLDKCTRNAWMNFFFINNMRTAPANCIPHTFYSSIDLQLFMIALFIVYLTCKNAKVGILTAVAFVFLGNGLLILATTWNTTSPVMIDAEATVPKTLAYLDYVHFATYGHFSNYMIGIIVGYLIKNPSLINRHLLRVGMTLAVLISVFIHFGPALHNTYGLLTPRMVPFYIVTIKFLYAFYFSMFVLQQETKRKEMKDQADERERSLDESKDANGQTKAKKKIIVVGSQIELFDFRNSLKRFQPQNLAHVLLQVPILVAQINWALLDMLDRSPLVRFMIKVSYSTYLINYAIIRWDFFTSRVHMDLVPMVSYSIQRRLTYTLTLTYLLAYFFHLIFVIPFDRVRRSLMSGGGHAAAKVK